MEKLINSGKWTTKVNDELLRKVKQQKTWVSNEPHETLWWCVAPLERKRELITFIIYHYLFFFIFFFFKKKKYNNLKHESRKRPTSDEMLKQAMTSKLKTTVILKKYKKGMLGFHLSVICKLLSFLEFRGFGFSLVLFRQPTETRPKLLTLRAGPPPPQGQCTFRLLLGRSVITGFGFRTAIVTHLPCASSI